jgi:hypothetical protein
MFNFLQSTVLYVTPATVVTPAQSETTVTPAATMTKDVKVEILVKNNDNAALGL